MNYKSFYDLSQDIKYNLFKIPKDVSLIVGIPRSGLLAANMIALYLNLPLTDIDGLIAGKMPSAGKRGENRSIDPFKNIILIVDDSIFSGAALQKARDNLQQIADMNYRFLFCCVYVMPGSELLVDIPMVMLDEPRVFEWNIFHHPYLALACVDIDGVLCIDPTEEENDDGLIYRNFLQTAVARFLPTVKIKYLITSRLEKYRPETILWLAKHDVTYDELIMLDLPDKETRQKLDCHAKFKAEHYKKNKESILFIESSAHQAQQIFELTGKPVYCVDSNEMLSNSGSVSYALKRKLIRKRNSIKSILKSYYIGMRKAIGFGRTSIS